MSFPGVCNSGGDIFVVGDERWLVITFTISAFLGVRRGVVSACMACIVGIGARIEGCLLWSSACWRSERSAVERDVLVRIVHRLNFSVSCHEHCTDDVKQSGLLRPCCALELS